MRINAFALFLEYNGLLEEAMKTSIKKLEQGAYNCQLCDKVRS